MLPEDPNNEWLKYVAYTIFAGIGGALGHVMRTIDARVKINWWYVLLQFIAAGFAGLLTLLLCMAAELSEPWTGVIVGVLGWMGANASIGVLSKVVFNKLGITSNKTPVRGREEDVSNSNVE